MLLGYVIGPFRADRPTGVWRNVMKARALALEVWRRGCACICPHANASDFDGVLPDRVWLEGDIEMLRRCDFAITVAGWENSAGSVAEVAECKKSGIPIFHSLDELDGWWKPAKECTDR